MKTEPGCPLCSDTGGELVWRDDRLRVILADEPLYPGFTRVVWNAHVAELSDLVDADRARLLDALVRVERVMREVLSPAKINLASLGNQVPHLHWHLIARWPDDAHFPAPVWAATDPKRVAAAAPRRDAIIEHLPAYREALRQAFA
ncbi:MAG: HIT family protein [Burkholderiaceae bacterium]|jgi:diadenosine tetraphosphate (Ap4A) HIT family hydrolase|nr:HIT family protein [Gemmatimonadales bacterium]MCO5121319.1 HIT family protein [Burkholderiaceae bacterium]MEB2319016.1 HIT family protein [Pseudomonadota bacterium]